MPRLPFQRPAEPGNQPAADAGQSARRKPSPLDRVPLFAYLPDETRRQVARRLNRRALPAGRVLFQVGDPANSLWIVETGRMRVFIRPRNGPEHVFRFLGPGEVVGEAAFMAGTAHVDAAEAVEPTHVWELTRPDFDALLGGQSEALRYLAQVIAQRQAQANTRLAAETAPDEVRAEKGFVTAVFSPRGGSGATTLALALGEALAERSPDEVALIDLDTTFGHALYFAYLNTGTSALTSVSPSALQTLDRAQVEAYVRTHPSSLRILPGALTPKSGAELTVEHVRAALSTFRRYYTHVVLDLPHNFSDVAITGLERADRVVLVATPDPATLRDVLQCRRILLEVLRLPEEHLRYVLNHPLPYNGLSLTEFAAATGSTWDEITFGGDGPAQAVLRGEPLVSTRRGNPLARAAERLAEQLVRAEHEAAAIAGR